jgi:uncharacterized protein (TIGR02246 family)
LHFVTSNPLVSTKYKERSMKKVLIALVPAIAAVSFALAQNAAVNTGQGAASGAAGETAAVRDEAADEAAIRANVQKYVEAFNRRDAQTMAGMWSPDAVYLDPVTNEGIVGRAEIAKHFDYVFAGLEDAKLAVTVEAVDFVSPNVAIERGSAVVSYTDSPAEESTYTAVNVKRDGQWYLDRVSEKETLAPRPSNYEHLRELEWMVGSWIDDAGDGVRIQSDCEWTKNRNFITRSFAVVIGDEVDMSGMQVIGWDPAANQIRSWVFDSDGGFGDGKWSRKENRWIIQTTGTLSDGGRATATNIMTQVNNDSFTWQSVNRAVDGELLPNVPAVLVVRKVEE